MCLNTDKFVQMELKISDQCHRVINKKGSINIIPNPGHIIRLVKEIRSNNFPINFRNKTNRVWYEGLNRERSKRVVEHLNSLETLTCTIKDDANGSVKSGVTLWRTARVRNASNLEIG